MRCSRRHRDIFGITSGPHRQIARTDKDGQPNRRLGNPTPLLDYRAAELNAGDRRKWRHPRIGASAHQHFRHADTDRVGFDEYLANSRPRGRNLDIFER